MGEMEEFSLIDRTFLRAYRWRKIDPVPWTPLEKPLSDCRLEHSERFPQRRSDRHPSERFLRPRGDGSGPESRLSDRSRARARRIRTNPFGRRGTFFLHGIDHRSATAGPRYRARDRSQVGRRAGGRRIAGSRLTDVQPGREPGSCGVGATGNCDRRDPTAAQRRQTGSTPPRAIRSLPARLSPRCPAEFREAARGDRSCAAPVGNFRPSTSRSRGLRATKPLVVGPKRLLAAEIPLEGMGSLA